MPGNFGAGYYPSDDEEKEIELSERQAFARAQNDMASNSDSGWTSTPELITLIRNCRSDRFASRAVKKFAKGKLASLWSPDLASLTPDPLEGALDVLMAARYSNLPGNGKVSKRALYELVRSPDLLRFHNLIDPPTEFFLSERQFFHLFLSREWLQVQWKEFVTVPPAVLRGPCPSSAASASAASGSRSARTRNADVCSAARRKCAKGWAETVGSKMLSEEYRYDPICSLDALAEMDWASDGVCTECVERLEETFVQKKASLWKELDTWMGWAEYDEREDAVEVTPWSRVWPDEDSGDEIPVVEEKKRKVDGGDSDGDVKVDDGEDPLLVKALAENAKRTRRKKVKVEAASKKVPRSDTTGEATGSGTAIKRENEASPRKEGQAVGGGKGARGGQVGGNAMARAINAVITQRVSDNKVNGSSRGHGMQTRSSKQGKKKKKS